MTRKKLQAEVEMIDVLDENGIKLGSASSRSEVHRRGLWHRIVVVAILDAKNCILMQQRSANKDKNPNMWDISVTGHLIAGQDSVSSACREIQEEVGLKIKEESLRYIFSYRKEQKVSESHFDRQFYDFFVLKLPKIDLTKIKMQESEVQQVKLISLSELKTMIAHKQVVERDETYSALFEYVAK